MRIRLCMVSICRTSVRRSIRIVNAWSGCMTVTLGRIVRICMMVVRLGLISIREGGITVVVVNVHNVRRIR